jgi:hypothetical protein
MPVRFSAACLVLVAAHSLGCGGATTDSAPAETGVDTSSPDTLADTTSAPDTAASTDSASAETMEPDTSTPAEAAPPCGVAPEATVQATLRLTADNERKVYVNGVLLDDAPYGWGDARSYDVTLFLHPKKLNVIAIEGINTSSQGGYDRGILAVLSSSSDAGTTFSLVSDANWKISSTLVEGWFALTASDATWAAALEQAPNGSAPWGAISDIPTSAKWIWSYDSSTSSTKTDDEHVYARRSFYFGLDGAPSTAPSTCTD